MDYSISKPATIDTTSVEELPQEILEHESPPSDKSGLIAWLRLQAARHADLAEQRPWIAKYHQRIAENALDAASFYEKREALK